MSDILPDNPDYSTINSPGAILKRCREYHGITLDEAAEATKIGLNYLRALEADQIEEFASQAYLKGFLRIYAAHLGLNADDMMRLYEKLYAPAELSADRTATSKNSNSRRQRRISWRRLALPAGLLLLIFMTSAIMHRSPAPTPPLPALVPASSTPTAPAVQSVLSSAQLPPVVRKEETIPVTAELPTKEANRHDQNVRPHEPVNAFILRMKVTSDSTLSVTIDGSTAQDYELDAGDIIEWKAEKSMALELSNAGGVEAELNGVPLKPFGPAGNPAYVVLDADGVRP